MGTLPLSHPIRLLQRTGAAGVPVLVGDRLLERLGDLLVEWCGPERASSAFVISDRAVASAAERVRASLAAAGMRVGGAEVIADERAKSLATVETLARALSAFGADRHSVIVAVGGGITGDVAGLVAATWMRGIRWVQAPTTLLGMVDAALGGKTAVNLALEDGALAKNMVGAVWQPLAVLSDVSTLASLPERSLRAGLAECVKHAILSDAGLLEDCRSLASRVRGDAAARADAARAIARAAQVKLDVVARDERESGDRMLLNLGHTFAHAIEAACPGHLLHGEAVSIGLVAAMGAACADGQRGGSPRPCRAQADEVRGALEALGLPVTLPAGTDPAEVRRAMAHDKKRGLRGLTLVLPRGGFGDGADIVRGADPSLAEAGVAEVTCALKGDSAAVR